MDTNFRYRMMNPSSKMNTRTDKFWSQQQNTFPEGMPQKINYQRREVKSMVDLLNEEYIKARRKKKDQLHALKSDYKNATSSRIEEHVSPYVKKMLKKIGKNINYIKKSITDITKMNGLYLEDKAKKTLFKVNKNIDDNNNNKAIPKLKLNKNNSDMNIMGNKTFNNNFENSEKNDDYAKNFVYVHDNYRKQLNFAFLKYNPEHHLELMKIMLPVDSNIRNDIDKIIQEVDEDIKWKCDKHHFKKKYENLLAKYYRSRSVNNQINQEENKEKNNKDKLPNIDKNKSKITRKNFKQKSFNKIYYQIKYGIKHNQKETNKLNAQREQNKEELNHMLIASKEIDNFIQNKNINNKIDMFKTDYAKQMYGYYDNETNNYKTGNFIKNDYFIEEKKNIVNKIGNVYSFQLDKNVNEKEKIYKGKIYNEAKKFRKRIVDGKKNAVDEFNGYITTYQVILPKDNKVNIDLENNDKDNNDTVRSSN